MGLVLFLAGSAFAQKDWTRNFRIGLQIGLNISADFKESGEFNVSGSDPGQPGVPGVNHSYDDGYVMRDQTGNAGGYTSNWGYNEASQYDPVAETLTFHSASSYSTTGATSASDEPYLGFDMAYGGKITEWGKAIVGWELGFDLLPIKIKDDQQLSAVSTRTIHRFDTGGIVLPEAPYHGGAGGLGPTISDVATALPEDTNSGLVNGSRELGVTLYTIRLGPTLHWKFDRHFSATVSAGGALGIVDGEYKFDETLAFSDGSQASNRGSFGDTGVVYGGYVGAVLMYRTPEAADIYVSAHFISLSDWSISDPGRQAQLNLGGGVFLAVGINWSF